MWTKQPFSTNSLPAHLIDQHISSDGQIWYKVQLEGSRTISWIRKDYIHLALALIQPDVSEAEAVHAEESKAEADDSNPCLRA